MVATGVRTNVTFESTKLIQEILEDYGKNYNDEDLEVTKGFMLKSGVRAFETSGRKLSMLGKISNYNYDTDYAKQREKIIKEITVADIKALAEKYIRPNNMIYLVVGDAATQMNKLEKLGMGKPILLNE